ncbi:FixH family protein [Dictyobacter aurantiacus]|uniref:YtkA-like domain-containing protein n=1 Tax=Dictyobacter aurantiacus TaxID=1936993 RepID=A0A401ZDV0_9CHLR|nr:FixH family protein [Dictyobacter aurantiacus]GCE05061.1 hypothetical protein KDAU_23900 [Dictyobacter aurantiacus]
MKRRQLLIVVLGLGFLIVITTIGTSLESLLPHHPTAPVQVAQAGPYEVTLRVDPNPPPTSQPAHLSLQIVKKAAGQLVSNAHVTLSSSMTTMDMGTEAITAQQQSPGIYQAQAHLGMSGTWEVRVHISSPGAPDASTTFDITASSP